jgi:hypothetical protein
MMIAKKGRRRMRAVKLKRISKLLFTQLWTTIFSSISNWKAGGRDASEENSFNIRLLLGFILMLAGRIFFIPKMIQESVLVYTPRDSKTGFADVGQPLHLRPSRIAKLKKLSCFGSRLRLA